MVNLQEVEKQIMVWYSQCDDADEVSELEICIMDANETESENRNYEVCE